MITMEQLWAMQDRLSKAARVKVGHSELCIHAAEHEDSLQEEIIKDARSRGWWVDFSRMDLPTTRPKGAPDVYVFADHGRLIIIEAKSKTGKVRPEQLGVKLALEKLGHTVHIVRSFGEYLKLI